MLLSTAMTSYLDYRRANGFRPNTVKNDQQAIQRLLRHCKDRPLPEIDAGTIDDLLGTMGQSGRYKTSTVNATMSSLSAFFKWARSRGHAPEHWNPIAGRRYIPVRPESRLYIGLSDFPHILDSAGNPRDRALMALGMFTLARQSELVNLRIRDLNLDSGTIAMQIVKTYDTDLMPMSSELEAEMRAWMTHYSALMAFPLDPDWYLVPAMEQDGFGTFRLAPEKPISRSADIVRRVLEAAGFTDSRVGIHTLRRSSARNLFNELAESGYDGALRMVSSMLHHAGTATTERYLSLDLDREKRDERIQGKPMFASLAADNVIPLRREGTDG